MYNQQKKIQPTSQPKRFTYRDKSIANKKGGKFQSIYEENQAKTNYQDNQKSVDTNGKNQDSQTVPFIEDLTNFDVVLTTSTQTDEFSSDEESEVNFVSGVDQIDQATQLDYNELWNFDEEVVPIIEVIMGNAIEKAIEELEKEDELAELEQTRKTHNDKVEEKLNEIKKLQGYHQEMVLKRELEESKIKLEIKNINIRREKDQAMKFAKSFVYKVRWSVISYIKSLGWLKDINKSIEEYIHKPYIRKQFYQKGIETYSMLQSLLNDMIKDSLNLAHLSIQ